ncbi:MAG: succinoglycan biosynthesis transport protein ExoP [Glaciecola sp.]|jgi:succinoglycan biosynthesis transport protein ExoP
MSPPANEQIEAKLINTEIIDFGQYWLTIKRYLWRIIGLAMLLTVLVALVVLSMTPRYIASASLLIEAEQANVLSIEEVYGLDSSRKEYFETQNEILRSRLVAEKVVDELTLYDNPLFNIEVIEANKSGISAYMDAIEDFAKSSLPFLPQNPKVLKTEDEVVQSRRTFAVAQVLKNTTISPIKNTQVVDIAFESSDRALAALIANTIADVYIENYLESKLDMTTKATDWLNESLQGLRTKLNIAERTLADFYEREQLVDIDGVVGLASEQLQQLTDQLIDAQVLLQRNRTIYQQVNQSGADFSLLSSLPDVLNHPSIQNIKREEVVAESKVSELKEVYGPKHPIMIAANAELNSINKSIRNQITVLISGITTEYRTAENKVAQLKKDVASAKSEFRKLSNLENQRKTFQRDVDTNQQLYNSFFTRLKETDQLGGFESANARILDAAAPPPFPAKPKKGLIIAAAFVLSLALGVFLALSLEAMNSGIRSVDDVERKLGQRMLGIIPWQAHKRKENLSLRHFFDNKQHMFSESVRTLRTSLQLLNLDKPSQTVLVTSSVPREGKSTVSINLAFAMGQLSKVLLLDTDLRRPTLAKQFDLPGFQPGLSNLIAGTHTLEECIVSDEQSGIDLICAGSSPPNPQELLASEQFKLLMAKLKVQYGNIIVDSAPTQAVSDAVIVSKLCDSVVYVVRSDSTSHKIINNGLSRFLQIGHRVDGVVLNQVDLKKAKKTGEYSGFYDQYGYQSYPTDNKKS